MQEANILTAVTGVVTLGLLVWVAVVLATVKTPWARPAAQLGSGTTDDVLPKSDAIAPSDVAADVAAGERGSSPDA